MEFNYTSKMKQFCRKWEQLRKEYAAAGMSKEAINKMYEYDLEDFRKERIYCMHTQFFPEIPEENDDGDYESENPLYLHFLDAISVKPDERLIENQFDWVYEIKDKKIRHALTMLNIEDLELITLFAISGYTVVEIAKIQKVSHQSISRKIKRIKNFLKTFD